MSYFHATSADLTRRVGACRPACQLPICRVQRTSLVGGGGHYATQMYSAAAGARNRTDAASPLGRVLLDLIAALL